ncbi:hypothetical protein ELI24_15320 [Rhizobium ruizarguesonis]|nr:hypothetical protein ELI24_15320 [Rhizobium ruizarguesonis]TAW17029.1 hypothetical protein ELI25_15040 [Rhizobium ruizarguesonis]TAZ52556.1 hypothetical protein ELH76_16030 [Rhizobium ruizarguesonis]
MKEESPAPKDLDALDSCDRHRNEGGRGSASHQPLSQCRREILAKTPNSPSLIPVPVTEIQPRRVRAVSDSSDVMRDPKSEFAHPCD